MKRVWLPEASWAVPKIDVKDPSLVLYLPLWYPDSETTGSTITSKDLNRHACTVTEATWGSQGRTFDGTDDLINCGASSALDITNAITIILWLNWKTAGVNWVLVKSLSGVTAERCYELNMNAGGGLNAWMAGTDIGSTTAISLGEWQCWAVTYDRVNCIIYLNGIADKTQARTVAITSQPTASLVLGRRTSANWYPGIIGEALIYNRALSAGEALRNYQVTKWRYS